MFNEDDFYFVQNEYCNQEYGDILQWYQNWYKYNGLVFQIHKDYHGLRHQLLLNHIIYHHLRNKPTTGTKYPSGYDSNKKGDIKKSKR